MPITANNSYCLNGVTTDMCARTVNGYTTSALARINVRPTARRPNPPDCGNGFITAELPFAKGHVIALELGGCDDAENVVPQFEMWQGHGNGPWRQMEIEIEANYGGKLMLVEIGYARTGAAQDGAAGVEAFQENHFIEWTDMRIPSAFSVSIFDEAGTPSGLASDQAYDQAVTALKQKMAIKTYTFDLSASTMPEPDYHAYVVQAGLDIAQPTLDRTVSFATYFMTQGALQEVRDGLVADYGIAATDANMVHAGPLIQAGQQITAPQLRKKHKAAVADGDLDMIPAEELFPN